MRASTAFTASLAMTRAGWLRMSYTLRPSGARVFDLGRFFPDLVRLPFCLPSTTRADFSPRVFSMPASFLVLGASKASLSTTTSLFSWARSESAEARAARFTFLGTV